ncbi:hypothetical protein [Palpita vitrealis nucleopolyhedrovirus]|uniref:Ac74 n=1 Tax=Palpita vitrealis nucleopolyhedrovirus TaxID=2951960 RepID=A0AAE9LNJ0_9ABAC|nr:hypothetical protein [Palpita vitrealis nucleopolyhedrovirus]
MKINLCNIQFQSLINLLNLQAGTMSFVDSNKIKANLIPNKDDCKEATLRLYSVSEQDEHDNNSSINFPLTTQEQKDAFIDSVKPYKTLHVEPDVVKFEPDNSTSSSPSPPLPSSSPINNKKIIETDNPEEYTVDGLKIKPQYVVYYKCLKILVDFLVMYVSKEVNMREYEQVYTLGRQLYELLRGIFVDEPFKLWLENNAHNFDTNKGEILDSLQKELKLALANKDVLKTCTFKNIVLDMLNSKFACNYDCVENYDYIKPNCIVDTYNCCNLVFKKQS